MRQRAGADGQARRDLALSRVGARQQQRRDVEAGEQQDGAEEHQQQAQPAFVAVAKVADAAARARFQPQLVLAREPLVERGCAFAASRRDLRENRLRLLLGRRERDARLQPRQHIEPRA